ncbi:hypothetical protein [Nitrospira tepida]|nr:hypothetical protein [Nitrospira tepida]
MACATLVITGATVVNVWVASQQWQSMQDTLTETRRASDAAAASTSALIAVERFVIKSIEKDGVVFDITFKNIGQTPALEAKAGFEFEFIGGPPNDFTGIPQYDSYQCPKTNVNLGILPPNKTWGTTLPTGSGKMSAEEIQMIKNRTAKIFIHACAKYRDVLTERERITEVGAYYPGTFDPTDLGVAIYGPYSRMK